VFVHNRRRKSFLSLSLSLYYCIDGGTTSSFVKTRRTHSDLYIYADIMYNEYVQDRVRIYIFRVPKMMMMMMICLCSCI